jgi:hypothetical protein
VPQRLSSLLVSVVFPFRPAPGLSSRAALLLVIAAAGCSSFERDWRALETAPEPPAPLAGRWQGSWRSEVTGHTGGLRAIVTRTAGETYEARYRATWGCCFTFEYTVPLAAASEGDLYTFGGEADLGWMAGGLYRYSGQATADSFRSTYSAAKDHGTFEMARPEVEGPE